MENNEHFVIFLNGIITACSNLKTAMEQQRKREVENLVNLPEPQPTAETSQPQKLPTILPQTIPTVNKEKSVSKNETQKIVKKSPNKNKSQEPPTKANKVDKHDTEEDLMHLNTEEEEAISKIADEMEKEIQQPVTRAKSKEKEKDKETQIREIFCCIIRGCNFIAAKKTDMSVHYQMYHKCTVAETEITPTEKMHYKEYKKQKKTG